MNEGEQVDLLSVTMTPQAALRFQASLHHAAARIEDEAHVEWLLWGASRVAYAQPTAPEEAASS
jgi:hypothetical protein